MVFSKMKSFISKETDDSTLPTVRLGKTSLKIVENDSFMSSDAGHP